MTLLLLPLPKGEEDVFVRRRAQVKLGHGGRCENTVRTSSIDDMRGATTDAVALRRKSTNATLRSIGEDRRVVAHGQTKGKKQQGNLIRIISTIYRRTLSMSVKRPAGPR
jgi:hypothetical protein